jgi:hypothetical protein
MMHGRVTDAELVALENISAKPGILKLGALLALAVEDKLSPALKNRKVQSCLHALDEINTQGYLPLGGQRVLETRQALLCPFHPERLICNKCTAAHLEHYHNTPEHQGVGCYVCQAPWREDFEGVVAQVQLHRPVPFYDDNRARGQWFTYSGDLWTLPVAWLCPRHKGAVNLPLKMAWPTVAADVTPESATQR